MSATAAAAITAGSALVGGAANAVVGSNLNKKNRAFYREMTEYQNQFNAEQAQLAFNRQRELYDYQFDKESAYNDPRAQMQRMKAAGLNPALLYGSGVGDAGSVAASPSAVGSASAASANPPQMQNYLTSAIESLSTVAQVLSDVNLKSASTEKTKADTELSRSTTRKVNKEAEQLTFVLEKMLPEEHKQLIQNLKRSLQDMQDSHQISTAQLEVYKQQAQEILSKIDLNKHTDAKLQSELKRFQEYIDAVYDRETYRRDIEKNEMEWNDLTKGVKNRILKGMNDPEYMNSGQVLQDFVLYFLTRIINF